MVCTTRTVQAAAVAAPIAATAETAWWLGFDAAAPTWVAVITVTVVLAAGFGLARKWAVTEPSPAH